MSSALETATDALAHRLAEAVVLPVLRTAKGADAERAVSRLVALGLPVIELTTTTPDWASVLAQCCRDPSLAHITFGVGTVTTADAAARAVETGAAFLVSPYPASQVRAIAGDTPFLEGGFSPGEVASAAACGIAKLFPAAAVGTGYLTSIRDVLPRARIVPTGGIELADVGQWLKAGALAVGIGGALLRTPADEVQEALATMRSTTPSTNRPDFGSGDRARLVT